MRCLFNKNITDNKEAYSSRKDGNSSSLLNTLQSFAVVDYLISFVNLFVEGSFKNSLPNDFTSL